MSLERRSDIVEAIRGQVDAVHHLVRRLPPDQSDRFERALDVLDTVLTDLGVAVGERTAGLTAALAGRVPVDWLLDAILGRLPVGVVVVEAPSGRPILDNEHLARLWRMSAGEGQDIRTIDDYARYHGFHPDGRPYLADEWPLARALMTGDVVDREEIEVVLGDGTLGTVEVSAAPIRDREGRIVAAVATFHDITERRQAERARLELALEQAARAAAEEAEARYRAWFQYGADAVILMDEEFRLVEVNEAAVRLFGYPRSDLLGVRLGPDGLLVGDPTDFATIRETLRREGRWAGELEVARKDGTTVPVDIRTVRIDLPTGSVYRGNFRDITERKVADAERERLLARALEAETRYRHLFEGTADAVLASDVEGRLLDANHAAHALLGYTAEELCRLRVTDIYRLASGSVEQEFARYLEQRHWEGEGEAIRKDGTTVPIEMRASVIDLPTGPAFVAVLHDISHRRTLERLRDEFVTLVTRELRMPLDSIRGLAECLQHARRLDESTVGGIIAQADHLHRLVGDLLDSSALAAGALRLNRSPRDLVALARMAVGQVQVIHPDCRMRVEAARSRIVGRWDPDRLAQVLDNLLEHATRYCGPGLEVLVQLEALPDETRLTVVTPGSTLPAHELPRLFDRFYQPAGRGGRLGLGSGLYIARGLIEAHGGRVWAGSNENGATTISCSLPYEAPPEPAVQRGPLTARQLEIATLIAQGLTNAQIAERLVLTEGTVANHIVNILRRLSFHSRTQIAAWASERGLVPPRGEA